MKLRLGLWKVRALLYACGLAAARADGERNWNALAHFGEDAFLGIKKGIDWFLCNRELRIRHGLESSGGVEAMNGVMDGIRVLEALTPFIEDPAEKREYLEALLDGNLMVVGSWISLICADQCSRVAYEPFSKRFGSGLIPVFHVPKFAHAFGIVSSCGSYHSNGREKQCLECKKDAEALYKCLERAREGKLESFKELYERIKKAKGNQVLHVLLEGEQLQKEMSSSSECESSDGSYYRERAAPVFEYKRKYPPEALISAERSYALPSVSFQKWVKECEIVCKMTSPPRLEYIPWAYFDARIFVNVCPSLDAAILKMIACDLLRSGIAETMRQEMEERVRESLDKLLSQAITFNGDEEGALLNMVWKGYTYNVIVACLNQTLDLNLFNVLTAQARKGMSNIKNEERKRIKGHESKLLMRAMLPLSFEQYLAKYPGIAPMFIGKVCCASEPSF